MTLHDVRDEAKELRSKVGMEKTLDVLDERADEANGGLAGCIAISVGPN
jgi:hypothetical protein